LTFPAINCRFFCINAALEALLDKQHDFWGLLFLWLYAFTEKSQKHMGMVH